ncbi:hypothetical protein TrRE_jg13059, partial [Triparma retinervis]
MASTNKYDRQLRLWGAAGQESLALSHVVLLGCEGTVGCETLKNLILPGVGGFTCIDKEMWVVSSNLQELNPDVHGSFLVPDCSLDEFISNDVPAASTVKTSLSEYLKQSDNVPYPLAAMPSTSGAKGTMIAGMPNMDQQQHGHVPYVALLMEALSRWRSSHSGAVPSTFAEKDEFRAALKGMSRDWNLEMNFQEGVREAYTAYTNSPGVPEHVREMMERADVKNLTKDSTSFCVLLSALSSFTKSHAGMPPLNGSIPDMTSDSESYIKLQSLYFERSKKELEEFTCLVQGRLAEVGLPLSYIPPPSIATFAKNVPYLTVV